jgi:hypothetical protein
MPKYKILDSNGIVLNTIIASEKFVKASYPNYELVVENNDAIKRVEEIEWRDSELTKTDSLILLPDYPYKEQLTAYRQALRDWPATEDFPDTRPTLGI